MIFLIILGSAFLDLVGISAIIPVIEILERGKDSIDSNIVLRIVNKVFSLNYDTKNICLVCLGLMSFLFIFKCAYSIFSTCSSLDTSACMAKTLT